MQTAVKFLQTKVRCERTFVWG